MIRELIQSSDGDRNHISKNLILALVILGALLACLTAVPFTSKQSAATRDLTAQPMPTPPDKDDEDEIKAEDEDGIWIKVVHDGAFLADFTVTWDEPGKKTQTRKESAKVNGFTTTFQFPAEATNIRLTITNDTGLVWQPKREIINRTLGAKDLNKCYKIVGTTLGSSVNTSCSEPESNDEDTEDSEKEAESARSWIKVVHEGAFLADFTVTWDEPGKKNLTRQETGKASGFAMTFEFPAEASNIRLKIQNDTGLVWQPKREIINRVLGANDMNKCYKIVGTTLGSSFSNDCQ